MPTTALEYQLEMIKAEIETINSTIRQMDDISKSIKEWTVGLWTAAMGGALATDDLTRYVGLTAAIPLLFWFVDTWHRRIQRKFIWRSNEIAAFLNSSNLEESIRQEKLVGFYVFDPQGRRAQASSPEEFDSFVSWRKVMFFKSLSILYLGLTSISLVVGIISAAPSLESLRLLWPY